MKPKKIAIVVPNPCNPDYRVIRQAETLARQGHEVRIYATKGPHTPGYEVFNGVTYLRERWHVVLGFIAWMTGNYLDTTGLAGARIEQARILKSAQKKLKQ